MRHSSLRTSALSTLIIVTVLFASLSPANAQSKTSQEARAPFDIQGTKQHDQETSTRYIGDTIPSPLSKTITFSTLSPRATGFVGRVDAHHVHRSGNEVSGHVSWTHVSGPVRKMSVKATLKAKTGWFGYSTKATSDLVTVWPGGGRGKAAVARYTCNGITATKWYNYGEGFAPGTQKPWGYHEGTVFEFPCGA